MKCNNCTKLLTCNRKTCKQVTYLQAGQIEKLEFKPLQIEKNKTLEEAIKDVDIAFRNLAIIWAKEMSNIFKLFK